MITFITGKPGGGKGLVAMQEIINELVNGDRCIITNLAIKLNPWVRVIKKRGKTKNKPECGLLAYLKQKYGQDFDAQHRILLLTDEQTKEFYLYRVKLTRNEAGGIISSETVIAAKEIDNQGKCVAYDTTFAQSDGGVVYCVDEAWKFYGAREWQNTSKGVTFYGAQHRKLNDRWLIVCQNTKQVDTAMRQVAEDFWVVTNHSKKKIGFFRQPDIFSVKMFGEVPSSAATEPMSSRIFTLEVAGLGGSYDTAGGVGMAGGGGADIGEKAKGLPFKMMFVLVIVLGIVIIGVAKGAGYGAGRLLTYDNPAMQGKKPERVTQTNDLAMLTSALAAKPIQRHDVVTNIPKPEPEPVIYVTGRAMVQWGKIIVFFSDGSSHETGDGELTMIAQNYVIVNGKKIKWGK